MAQIHLVRPLGTAQVVAPPETLLPVTIQTTIMHSPVSTAQRVSLAWQVDTLESKERQHSTHTTRLRSKAHVKPL